MASRRNLITVSYHDDDDTGMYEIDELDFGVSGEVKEYCERNEKGRKDIAEMLIWLAKQILEGKLGTK